nr:DUF1589 domain-containing protein [Rhodopirellula islandica]
MLWNKARRQRNAVERPTCTGQEPSPGKTWPTAATSIRSRIRQNSVHARRPCLTWHPRRCFGTKRGVIKMPSRDQRSPAKNHRQVKPGLQQPRQFVAGFAKNSVHARSPCLTWHPRRCFGTKRGVIKMPSRDQRAPAKNHRQVKPGLQLQ